MRVTALLVRGYGMQVTSWKAAAWPRDAGRSWTNPCLETSTGGMQVTMSPQTG